MSVGAIKSGSAYIELFTRNNRLVSGLNDASRRLKAFGASVQQIGRQMAMFGIGAAIPIGLSVRRFAEFDDKMREVQAVTQSTDAQLRRLTETARTLGQTTSFTAVEVASLMAELGRADFNAEEIEAATEAVLNLARATVTDATLAASVMVRTMKQYGLAATEAARVSDALTIAANRSVSTVESLGESLEYTGPVARQFGMSLEDTLAILGTLGNIGIEGSNAGTALRRLLILTGTQAEQLRNLFGVEANDAAGNARPLVNLLDEISRSIEHLGTAERQAKLFDLFGFLGITAASGVGDNLGNVLELSQALDNAAGSAGEAARRMDAGIGGTFRRLRGAIENVALSIGESLDMALRSLGGAFRTSLNDMGEWIRQNKGMVIAVTLAVSAIIALGVALIGLGVAFKLVGFAIGAVGTVLAIVGGAFQIVLSLVMGLLSPLSLIGIALASGTAAWLAWADNGQVAFSALSRGLSGLLDTAQTTMGGILTALQSGDLQLAWDIALAGMNVAWIQLTEAISTAWQALIADLLAFWHGFEETLMLSEIWDFLRGFSDVAFVGPTELSQDIPEEESAETRRMRALIEAVRQFEETGDESRLRPSTLPEGITVGGEFLEFDPSFPGGFRINVEAVRRQMASLAAFRELDQLPQSTALMPSHITGPPSPALQAAQQHLDELVNQVQMQAAMEEAGQQIQAAMEALTQPEAAPPGRTPVGRGGSMMPGLPALGLMMVAGIHQALNQAEKRVSTAATFSGTLAATGGLEFGDDLSRVMQDQLGVQRRIERNTRAGQLFQ